MSINLSIQSLRDAYQSELLFYTSFHKNETNWAIHAVSIPFEWTSWLLFLAILNIHWHVAVIAAVYYVVINSYRSVPAAIAQIVLCWIAERIFQEVGTYPSLAIAATVQLSAWFVQVYIGHKIYEKNMPAMTVKLTLNSILLSPLLAWACPKSDNCTHS